MAFAGVDGAACSADWLAAAALRCHRGIHILSCGKAYSKLMTLKKGGLL